MSPDDVDSLVLKIADWIDLNIDQIGVVGMDHDPLYYTLKELVEVDLDPFITKERNYN